MTPMIMATAQGFSAFVAFGLQWPGSAGSSDRRFSQTGVGDSRRRVIEVAARRVAGTASSQLRDAAAGLAAPPRAIPGEPLLIGYLPSAGRPQAPRLLYAPVPRGQWIDTIA